MMKNFLILVLGIIILGCNTVPQKALRPDELIKDWKSLCGPTPADLNTEPGYSGKLSPLFKGLDVYHFPISSSSEQAQSYFNQGIVLNFGFNHAEAARSFREAIRQDEKCAACYWGLGYVLGPNYNAGMDLDVLTPAKEAITKAQLYAHNASPRMQAMINALSYRYPKNKDEDPMPYYEVYAEKMKEAHLDFPKDLDIQVLYAESLMDLHPWDMFKPGGEIQPWTREILNLLESALEQDNSHPQAMHLYMHALEASPYPEKGLEVAKRLEDRVPGSGHLVHMPSHLYINTGHYIEGTEANERAVKIDSAYIEGCHADGVYPLAYYPHNWHFLAACAALSGQGDKSLRASRYMADFVVDKTMMRSPELATLQHYYTIPWYIMVKFGMWDEILLEKTPEKDLIYPLAIWRYARAMAYSNLKDFKNAKAEIDHLSRHAQDSSIQELTVWDINNLADLVDIALRVSKAEYYHQMQNYDLAKEYFRKAIKLEDQLNYNEPPDWFFSIRHLLGHTLIESKEYQAAIDTFKEDLTVNKNNGWALKGLQTAYEKLAMQDQANLVKLQFLQAWKHADVELSTSRL